MQVQAAEDQVRGLHIAGTLTHQRDGIDFETLHVIKCVSTSHPLCHCQNRVVEVCNYPKEWMDVFVVEEGPNERLTESILSKVCMNHKWLRKQQTIPRWLAHYTLLQSEVVLPLQFSLLGVEYLGK